MTLRQIHLLQLGLESWALSFLVYFFFTGKKIDWDAWRARFSSEALRNWNKERMAKELTRQAVAFLFYSGAFLVLVALA